MAFAQQDLPGGCPSITGSWNDTLMGIVKLDKLQGQWRNVYDHMHKEDEKSNCLSMKLVPVEGNPLLLQMKQGSFQEYEATPDYQHEVHGNKRMVYDDSVYLNFSMPDDSSVAALGGLDPVAELLE